MHRFFIKSKAGNLVMLITFFLMSAGGVSPQPSPTGPAPQYRVGYVNLPPQIDADWEKPFWKVHPVLTLKHYMGEKPQHFPRTRARLAYDTNALYVIFQVQDQYVRAVAEKPQDPVYKDSCVEFFFSPEEDSDSGYFNLEMNCGGTLLFQHQLKRGEDVERVSGEDIERISIAHSLPRIVDPEIQDSVTWTVEYRLPFKLLTRYAPLRAPDTGTRWRANFYKCADATSHPHWLTWAPVDHPKPNFHLPEFFGTLVFD